MRDEHGALRDEAGRFITAVHYRLGRPQIRLVMSFQAGAYSFQVGAEFWSVDLAQQYATNVLSRPQIRRLKGVSCSTRFEQIQQPGETDLGKN